MTPRELLQGIHASWSLAERLGLALSFSNPWSLEVDSDFRDVTLDRLSQYEEVYLLGLRKSHYNFILNEYSYFQFAAGADWARYAFYPNPFRPRDDEMLRDLSYELKEGVITFEDFSQILAEESVTLNVPPIRYEYAPHQYREFHHPCAHMHIGHYRGNRWPVARRLSPAAFTMIVVKQCYGEEWVSLGDEQGERQPSLNQRMAIERERCYQLGEEHFSGAERRLFHFV
jgi:hypothetical protein